MTLQSQLIHTGHFALGCFSKLTYMFKKSSFGFSLFLICGTTQLFAQSETTSNPEPEELPIDIQQKLTAYQHCISSVMSTFEPAGVKRQQITENCQEFKILLINAYPEDIQVYVNAYVTDRLDSVLSVLEQSERLVEEAAADSNDIAKELEALSEKISQDAAK